ncbi:pentapeptide repeat-containing protein [Methylocapsa polymorpha]|uniref:Pentapeptide repeat-containing protein n=1 Tax=Methylocapsa polymorpha TaxID=3080828 RepID=A0ABZ0HWG2_9HYPH|nr:pentapeptide repeat-containing protein [Methylocapsa sp. RX1]
MSKRLREMRLSRVRAARAEAPIAPPDPIEKFAEKADDLDEARKSVEDAASLSGGLWLSYLFALFYIGIAAGGVTHTDLLLENSVKLPFLGVDLPLVAFFALGPILFVISHAYTLMNFVLLAGKVGTFNSILGKKLPDPEARPTQDVSPERAAELRDTRLGLRRQLPSNIFVQFLAGPRDIRDGGLGWMLKAVAWISLVVGPVLLLLLLQVQFLPYHLAWVTWIQRLALVADVALLWFLWPAVLASRCEIQWPRLWRHPVATAASLIPIGLAMIVARFPGEWMDAQIANRQWIPLNLAAIGLEEKNPKAPPKWTSFHDLLFNGDVDELTLRRKSLFSNTLVLPKLDALKAAKVDNLDGVTETLTLKGRHFENAVFNEADLRKANLDGANLRGASFYQAKLQGARFYQSELQGARLEDAELQCASLGGAKLQGASLAGAVLLGAYAEEVKLQGASLNGANLQAAVLSKAELQDASLHGAKLQGASLQGAELQGAEFDNEPLAISADAVPDLRAMVKAKMTDDHLLGFAQCAESLSLIPDAAPIIEGKSVQGNTLANDLKTLVCSGDENAAYIVRGLIKNERIGATGGQARWLVDAILNPKTMKDCPVSSALTDEDRAALQKIADASTP